jgi:TIR domain
MNIGLADAPAQYQGKPNGANLDDAFSAIKEAKSRRARERHLIRVFLSHKKKDFKAANQIRDVLRINSAGRIDVFMSENITKGDDWQGKIEQALYESDWFVLLFSGVDDDWSWCHHEAGIFRGMVYPDSERLVVLYPPNVELPDPLKKYQAVKCQPPQPDQPDELDLFFKEIFGKPPYPGVLPINPVFANEASDTRRDAAAKIVDAVGCLVVESIVPEHVMFVHVPDVNLLTSAEFPDGTCIWRGSGAMRLFELGNTGFSWREFQARLDPELRHQLDQSFWPAIYRACSKSLTSCRVASTHAVLRSPADGRHYMPVISRVDITGDNSATFSISFVQVAAGTQAEVRDKSVARIFTALNLAHRFRWEIIDPYRDRDRLQAFVDHRARTMDPSGAGATNGSGGLAAIWEAIRLIETESQNRGVSDEHALPADFGPSEARVRAMFPLWYEKRQQLDQAAQSGDVATFAGLLAELDPINVEFISLASQRLGELVRADASHQ